MFNKTQKPKDIFSEFAECNEEMDTLSTTVFRSPDERFESPRKIGKRRIQVVCPECGHLFETEVANYDMKTGQKTFLNEMG